MIRAFRSELVKLRRCRVLVVTAVATVAFAVGAAAIVLSSAGPAGGARDGRGPTVESLAGTGGGTEVFTTAVSFAGTFLFVVFVGAMAVEFSRGTMRAMLLRQPGRIRLLAGKLAGLVGFAAVVLAGAEVVTWTAARLLAPSQDISTREWATFASAGHALADYGSVLFWVSGYAILGTTIAVLARSVPVALAVGIAWAGPFEHLLQDGWEPASRLFPGLLLEAFVAGGTPDVSATRAFVTVGLYMVVAGIIAGAVFARRDVTA